MLRAKRNSAGSVGFFSISPTLEPIPQTIKEYFDVYCRENLSHLCAKLGNKETKKLLMNQDTKTSLESIKDPDLNAIFIVLRRLITGELKKSEPLMKSLRRVDENKTISDFNSIISKEITAHTARFFDGMCSSPCSMDLSLLLPNFMK